MSDLSLPPAEPGGPALSQRLTDYVLARLQDARRDLQRSDARRSKSHHRRVTDSDTAALRRVFLDLGESYRRYRTRTGQPVSAEVRDAALKFRRDLDLTSLVSVAATLERHDRDMMG